MAYKRKTKDVWCIETNYGYGWETESEYDEYEQAKADLKEYKLHTSNDGGSARMTRRREKIKHDVI